MKHRLSALTSTRGIAALLVVIFHFGCTVWPFSLFEHFFRSGNLAVGYFFVLSGFVMYYTYHNRQTTYGNFIRRRFARIAPVYYAALALSVAYIAGAGGLNWLHILLNATFTQAFFPGYALTVNSPGWTLSVEMCFYMLFPLLLGFETENKKRFIWFAILVYIISQALHLYLVHAYQPVWGTALHEFVYYFPLFHLNEFLLGMVGGYFFAARKGNIRMPPILLFILIVLLISFLPGSISLHNGLLAPLYVLLILAVAVKEPPVLKWRPLVFAGEISYGVYILQEPLHRYAVMANDACLHLREAAFFYAYCAFLLLLASISYRFIEKPLRNFLNRA